MADVANKSASQLFGNKISDMLETLAKEHQLHFIFKDKEKSSTSSVKCKYNGLLNGGLLQRPRRGQTTIQGKNKSTHKKTVCDSEIVSSEFEQLQDKELAQATEVWNIEKIKKHF